MVRETAEETGLITRSVDRRHFGVLQSHEWRMDVFALHYQGDPAAARSAEDQRVEWCPVASFPGNILNNLAWLVPLAHDYICNGEFDRLVVRYK